ncbi:MAG: pyridoxamine kinase [Clostridia bacterium]|nr:pyridoxamine kinase [Clostridia bacterium]
MTDSTKRAVKRVAAINDISCHGKCSLTVALPVLSACEIEAVPVPTALLSTHTGGFSGYSKLVLTDEMENVFRHFDEIDLGFDGIFTGYFCSRQQILIAEKFLNRFGKNALTVVDPVMADNGSLYAGFSDDFPEQMLRLIPLADTVTPNVTEAFLLAGEEYRPCQTKEDTDRLLKGLLDLGARNAVITGVSRDGTELGYVFAGSDGCGELFFPRVDRTIHGCGDVFASVLTGKLLCGDPLPFAVEKAARFTQHCIERTLPVMEQHPYGLLFEPSLSLL